MPRIPGNEWLGCGGGRQGTQAGGGARAGRPSPQLWLQLGRCVVLTDSLSLPCLCVSEPLGALTLSRTPHFPGAHTVAPCRGSAVSWAPGQAAATKAGTAGRQQLGLCLGSANWWLDSCLSVSLSLYNTLFSHMQPFFKSDEYVIFCCPSCLIF